MVSGIGPATTLQSLNIPVIKTSESVGQNMIVCLLPGARSRRIFSRILK